MFFNSSSRSVPKWKPTSSQPELLWLGNLKISVVQHFFFILVLSNLGEQLKNIKNHTRKNVKSLLQIDFLSSIVITFHPIDNKINHLLDDFPSLLSGRLVPFKARRVLLLPLTTSGGSRYNLWWMMIINIDYDDDHGFDDGDNDVTSSPPSSTDHLWWYLRWCSSWLSWSCFLVKKYLFLVIVLHWVHGVIS